jgi:hypothetical protein
MRTFVSTRRLFKIVLPIGWQDSFENNVYTFQHEENSALQISAMFHPGKEFVLPEELDKEQKKHPSAQFSGLSKYRAVHYGVEIIDERMFQYVWVTGYRNVKLLCTLTISSDQENEKLDTEYEKAVGILDTLEIFPPNEHN